jgi:hypothetical protein
MTQAEALNALKAGRKLRFDPLRCGRKYAPLLSWLLGHPDIGNKFVQADDRYSYIEFWWHPSTTPAKPKSGFIFRCIFCGDLRDNNQDNCPRCGGYGWEDAENDELRIQRKGTKERLKELRRQER